MIKRYGLRLVTSCVQRGMDFLDKECPGWEEVMDPKILDISCGQNCVIGQIFGDYGVGIQTLDINAENAPGLGFESTRKVTYKNLNICWKKQIKNRLAALAS